MNGLQGIVEDIKRLLNQQVVQPVQKAASPVIARVQSAVSSALPKPAPRLNVGAPINTTQVAAPSAQLKTFSTKPPTTPGFIKTAQDVGNQAVRIGQGFGAGFSTPIGADYATGPGTFQPKNWGESLAREIGALLAPIPGEPMIGGGAIAGGMKIVDKGTAKIAERAAPEVAKITEKAAPKIVARISEAAGKIVPKFIDSELFAKSLDNAVAGGKELVSKLKIPEYAAGNIDRAQVEAVKSSIMAGDKINPIVINKAGDILDGAHRLIALKELGIKNVQTVVQDVAKKAFPKVTATGETAVRGFAQSVAEGAPKVAKKVMESASSYYNPITNKQTLAEATSLINGDMEKARSLIFDSTRPLDAMTSAVGQLLIREAEKVKDYGSAARIADQLVQRATSAGQGIQALSLFSKLTPEGIVRYAASTIAKAQDLGIKIPALTAEKTALFVERAKALQKLPDGSRERLLGAAELLRDIHELVPASTARKISGLQTMAQLLNPKTIIRNLGGNAIFSAFENLSRLASTGADVAVSKATGKRTVVLPDILAQTKGLIKGAQQGAEEVARGVSTKGMGAKFEISDRARTFTSGVLGGAEKAMGYVLQVPDRAFYNAAYDEELLNQAKTIAMNEKLSGAGLAAKVKELVAQPTEEMMQAAHLQGLYRTFQDTNFVTNVFQGLKKAMNVGKEFGLGDFVIKYPKTPANLLARAAEYTPLGFARSAIEVVKPLIGKGFDQRAFVDSLGRATVGSGGLTALGSILYKAGILSGAGSTDKDLNALEQKVGVGKYRVNVDGLKRFVLSGFDPAQAKLQPGDNTISYDWAQPLAPALALGAEVAKGTEKKAASTFYNQFNDLTDIAMNSLDVAVNTLAEQPLVQGVKRFWGTEDPFQAIVQTIASAPSSFVPTLLSQINQVIDNTTKETYDPNIVKAGLNSMLAKIPILEAVLPTRYDIFGDPAQRYQNGGNNLFNVFINPAFTGQYLPTPEAKFILDLYHQTGETKQIPKIVPKTLTVDGKQYKLSADEYVKYQQALGLTTKAFFSTLANNPAFTNAPVDGQIKVLSNTLSKLNDVVKAQLFGIVNGKLFPGLNAPGPLNVPPVGTQAQPLQVPGGTTFNRSSGTSSGSKRIVARIRTAAPKSRKINFKKLTSVTNVKSKPIAVFKLISKSKGGGSLRLPQIA